MAVKIQLRRGTEAEFDSANTTSTIIPADGEVLVVQESGTTGGYLLIGDGSTNYLTLKGDEDGRVYFKPGYSKTVMGGEHLASETPLTVRGATSQSVPIFVVENKAGLDIFRVSDDESSGSAALVAVESHGQTADVVMSVMGQEDQDDDNAGGDLLRVQPDVNHTGKGLVVDHSGNVTIVPVDDSGVNDTALKIVAPSDNDNPIVRIQKADATDVIKFNRNLSTLIQPVFLGSTPDHTDPSNFGVIRTGTTPNNTDSSAAAEQLDQPHFHLFTHGSGTGMRGTLNLTGNSAVGGGVAIGVRKSGDSANQATIFYNGKGEFKDGTIVTTGRTLAAASILRADEVYNRLSMFRCVTSDIFDDDYNTTTLKLLPISLDSGSGSSFATNVTGEMFDPPTLHRISGNSSDPVTGEPGTAGDVTNFYLVKVPANTGEIEIGFSMATNDGSALIGFQPSVVGTQKIFRYTSDDAVTGKTEVGTNSFSPSSTSKGRFSVQLSNLTFDAFYGFAFDGNHDTGNSSGRKDELTYNIDVRRAQ